MTINFLYDNIKTGEIMDKIMRLKIPAEMHGKTVKYILQNHLGLSASVISQLKQTDDGIMLSGERVFVDKKVCKDDELTLTVSDERSDIPASDIPLDIIYEDEDIIAISKPRNMPTHPSQNHYEDTLANGLMHYYADKNFTFRAITRLDRDTSGVVLVAKNPVSAAILGDAMKQGKIKKEYAAVVCGVPNPPEGTINAPIKRMYESVILRCVSPDGKEAVTDYETVSSGNELSLVRLFPKTGRTHQLRVHLSHIGTPIYGDDLYGANQKNESTRLHCRKITFTHPLTKTEMEIVSPLPEDMTDLIGGTL